MKLPTRWLMTDPRFGERLFPSIQRLARGSGVIFRHYDAPNRLHIYRDIAKICRRRGLMLVIAGDMGRIKGDEMRRPVSHYHGRPQKIGKQRNAVALLGVHDAHEIRDAMIFGTDAYFLSPVLSTNSHKGQRPMGILRFRQLSQLCDKPVIALGGMNQIRFQPMKHVHGYAAIDGFIR